MVKTTATSKIGLASTARSQEGNSDDDSSRDVRPVFASAAIGMSWQLAIVVLLPILGGYKLDQLSKSSPAWTLAGLVVALVLSIFVVRRALAAFGNFNPEGLPDISKQSQARGPQSGYDDDDEDSA